MKILVTGGAGFIGSHTIRKLLDKKYNIICVDNLNNFYNPKIKINNLKPFLDNKKFKFYKVNICNNKKLANVFANEKIDKIIHLAARAGVRPSLEKPEIYAKTNILGTLNLLELSVKHKIKNFVFASSSSIYGNNNKVPFSENDIVDDQLSPYAATKKASELLAKTYHNLYGLKCTGLRFFTVYGPSSRPDMAPYLFVDSIYHGREIKKFGDGTSKRDYTFIDDITDGIISALDKNLDFEIINLGNNKPIKLNYFISVIEKLLDKKANIKKFPSQMGDMKITYADISKAKKILNFQPKVSIEQGMQKMVEWYLENRITA
ncbi:MAG: GDP-mannose 4,6-dehydratase [Patescibacteria group bacterium]|nr:GDP-mannose 4,6-dehydratase [Patescibacteria group bacterium]